MRTGGDDGRQAGLPPDDAFTLLGANYCRPSGRPTTRSPARGRPVLGAVRPGRAHGVRVPGRDSPIEESYEDSRARERCTDCDGLWPQQDGTLLWFGLPPRGLRDRTPAEILEATVTCTIYRNEVIRNGVRPDCVATVDSTLTVCADHDDICDACGVTFLGIIDHVHDSWDRRSFVWCEEFLSRNPHADGSQCPGRRRTPRHGRRGCCEKSGR